MPPKKLVNLRRRLAHRGLLLPRIRTDEKNILAPVFLTRQLRKTIERLLPAGHHQRLRLYFDTYGCLRCSCNDLIYGGNGFCRLCLRMLERRLEKIDTELRKRLSEPSPDLEEAYLRPYRSARKLLADLVPKTDKRTSQTKPEPKHPPKVYVK
jgi:hypothetical protein